MHRNRLLYVRYFIWLHIVKKSYSLICLVYCWLLWTCMMRVSFYLILMYVYVLFYLLLIIHDVFIQKYINNNTEFHINWWWIFVGNRCTRNDVIIGLVARSEVRMETTRLAGCHHQHCKHLFIVMYTCSFTRSFVHLFHIHCKQAHTSILIYKKCVKTLRSTSGLQLIILKNF